MSYVKKLLLCVTLIISILGSSIMPVIASIDIDSSNGDNTNEEYYAEVAQLIQETWKESYFGEAILSVGSDILQIDSKSIKMDNKVEEKNGELIIPVEALEKLGVEIETDAKGIKTKKDNKFIEIEYGNKIMRVNGNKKGMPAEAAIKNGNPTLPVFVLDTEGLGFEIDYKEDNLIITNQYQMMRLIVKMKDGKMLPNNIKPVQTIEGFDNQYIVQFNSEEETKEACELLKSNSNVVYAEPDEFVMLDDESINAANAAATFSHYSWGATRIGADNYLNYLIDSGKQNTSVVVAVLDTGLDTSHPYFKNRHIPGYNFISTNSAPNDVHSHGTHVSGTIIDITIGAPNVKIMPVKVLGDTGSGSSIGVDNGIRWAADNGAKVINMSLGGASRQARNDVITYAKNKGVITVVAAGNDAADAKDYSPANCPDAITVSAIDSASKPASFTNFGNCVDVAAPGVGIISTIPGGGTGSKSGTSMASPHVAGAVALLVCNNPSMKTEEARMILGNNVDAVVSSNNRYYGKGIINLTKAIGGENVQFLSAIPGSINCNVYSGAKQQQLEIQYYDKGIITDVSSKATYVSNNTNIATVTTSGLVTVKAVGQTNIVVSYNGKNVTIPVVGESNGPLVITGSTPVNGAVNVGLEQVIRLDLSRKLSKAITFTLVDSKGKSTSWKQQAYGSNYVNITLSSALSPGLEHTLTIKLGGIIDELGETIEKDFVLKFTTLSGDLNISTTSLAKGKEHTTYSAAIAATGGTAPYTFTVTGLPAGLSMTTAGVISGKPTAAGTFNVNITLKDAVNKQVNKTFQLVIDPLPELVISTSTLANAKEQTTYSATIAASGGLSPYTFTATGLPTGLSITTSGVISGKPTVIGTFNINITLKDSSNKQVSKTLVLKVEEIPPLTINTGALSNAKINNAYSASIVGSGGISPYTYSATGLPAGLSMTTAGVISGKPTVDGTFNINITLKDSSNKQVSKTLVLIVEGIPPIIINTNELAKGKINTKYNVTLSTTGSANANNNTWTAVGLPKGLSIDKKGAISGTPTEAGEFSVKFTVVDKNNAKGEKTFLLVIEGTTTIIPTVTITTNELTKGQINAKYSMTLAVTGGTSAYTWSATGLPKGLTISTAGVISGTPTETGNFTVKVMVVDKNGVKGEKSFVLTINPESIKREEVKFNSNFGGSNKATFAEYKINIAKTGALDLNLTNNNNKANLELILLDMNGKEIARVNNTNGKAGELNLNITSTGVYTLRINLISGNGNFSYTLTATLP